MIDDVTPLSKLHVIDFTGRLHPLKPVLVRELRPFRHRNIASLHESILRQLRIVPEANEALHFKRRTLGSSFGISLLIIIKDGCI